MQTADELRLALAEAEERETREALARSHGSVTAAARALGVSKPTIYRRMERYGLRVKRVVEDAPLT